MQRRVKVYHSITRFLKKLNKPFFLFFLGCLICTCVDPFNPNIKGQGAILVVDALLTNEDRSYIVELSRTTPSQNEDPVMVSGALVSISDQNGIVTLLNETANGIYKTDSLSFHGETGNTYTLSIKTLEGTEYSSEKCTMYPVNKIDNIYFQKDQEIQNNNTVIVDGIRIFLDSGNSDGGKYFRWIYDEWWKFSIPNPKRFDYIDQSNIPEVDQIKQVCYQNNVSNEILIHSVEGSQTESIEREPVLFVPSARSDRLLIQYCIDIKQLSLSDSEFQFWEQMKQLTGSSGDIFDKQPFSIIGNIHNVNNPSEMVLGYFQVSAVEEKRLYIVPEDLKDLALPEYSYDCERVEIGPSDYPSSQDPSQNMTFDKIYASYTRSGYFFIEPIYDLRWNLQKLVFTKPACAICTTRGSLTPPEFWIDIESFQRKNEKNW